LGAWLAGGGFGPGEDGRGHSFRHSGIGLCSLMPPTLVLLVQQPAELVGLHLRVAHQVRSSPGLSVRWSGTVSGFLEGSLAWRSRTWLPRFRTTL